jgi:hypothetical protein
VSDIDIAVVVSLKALDLKLPIREADILQGRLLAQIGSVAVVAACPLLCEQRKTSARGEDYRF